ncbi:hypothetical protein ACFE04_011120 [Oxalis oulophora]
MSIESRETVQILEVSLRSIWGPSRVVNFPERLFGTLLCHPRNKVINVCYKGKASRLLKFNHRSDFSKCEKLWAEIRAYGFMVSKARILITRLLGIELEAMYHVNCQNVGNEET